MGSLKNYDKDVAAEKLDEIIDALDELQTQVDNLRDDFVKHDHGNTYATQVIRKTVVSSVASGTLTASATAKTLPSTGTVFQTGL